MIRTMTILSRLYGVFWLVFGLNGFLHFFPVPQPHGAAADFIQALEQAGYVFPAVYAGQIMAGVLLLSIYTPLALLILAPIVTNIMLYDAFLNPAGLSVGLPILAVYVVLVLQNQKFFKSLISTR